MSGAQGRGRAGALGPGGAGPGVRGAPSGQGRGLGVLHSGWARGHGGDSLTKRVRMKGQDEADWRGQRAGDGLNLWGQAGEGMGLGKAGSGLRKAGSADCVRRGFRSGLGSHGLGCGSARGWR